jgi:hypothetical protein
MKQNKNTRVTKVKIKTIDKIEHEIIHLKQVINNTKQVILSDFDCYDVDAFEESVIYNYPEKEKDILLKLQYICFRIHNDIIDNDSMTMRMTNEELKKILMNATKITKGLLKLQDRVMCGTNKSVYKQIQKIGGYLWF